MSVMSLDGFDWLTAFLQRTSESHYSRKRLKERQNDLNNSSTCSPGFDSTRNLWLLPKFDDRHFFSMFEYLADA